MFEAIGYWGVLTFLVIPAPSFLIVLYFSFLHDALRKKGIPDSHMPWIIRKLNEHLYDREVVCGVWFAISLVGAMVFFLALLSAYREPMTLVEVYSILAQRVSSIGGIVLSAALIGLSVLALHKIVVFSLCAEYKLSNQDKK